MEEKIAALQAQREEFKLLYVEDNEGLRRNVQKLVGRFFEHVFIAKDGMEGFELFKAHEPHIVITDIKMPHMDGLELTKKIHAVNPYTKVIILSAYDTKEHLLQAIEHNVFRYVSKPARVQTMVDTLYDTQNAIKEEESFSIFQNQLQDVFNYQNHLVMMLENDIPTLVNRRFLEFFGIENLSEFTERFPSLDPLLLQHNGFLYSTPEADWYAQAKTSPGKLFHSKIADHTGENHHLILKLQNIPNKQRYTILSLDDITELNLLMLFDSKTTMEDKRKQSKETIIKMMRIVKENAAEVKIHNYYKGLTITNPAVVVGADEHTVLQTTYTQLKAATLVKTVIISSEIFPNDILCHMPDKVDFDAQTLTLSQLQFVERSPTERRFIRLEPEPEHTVTFFYRGLKVFTETRIIDLSECSVKISLQALPPKVAVDDPARVSMVLPDAHGPLPINTEAVITRIDEHPREFHVVLMFELNETHHAQLKHYLAERQMALIREFKALNVASK